jgi:hypothetical protein
MEIIFLHGINWSFFTVGIPSILCVMGIEFFEVIWINLEFKMGYTQNQYPL